MKEAKNTPPITPVEPLVPSIEAPTVVAAAPTNEPAIEEQTDVKAASPVANQVDATSANPDDAEQSLQAEQDIPQPSIEVTTTRSSLVTT